MGMHSFSLMIVVALAIFSKCQSFTIGRESYDDLFLDSAGIEGSLNGDYNYVDMLSDNHHEQVPAANDEPLVFRSEEETISGSGQEELRSSVRLAGLRGDVEGKTLLSESVPREEATTAIPEVTRGHTEGQVSGISHEPETGTAISSVLNLLVSEGDATTHAEAGETVSATAGNTKRAAQASDVSSVSVSSTSATRSAHESRRRRSASTECVEPSVESLRALLLVAEDTAVEEDTGIADIDRSSTSCPADLLQSTSGPVMDRALCPWRNILHTDVNRYPRDISMAQCACPNCIDPHQTFDLSAMKLRHSYLPAGASSTCNPIKQERVVLKKVTGDNACTDGVQQYEAVKLQLPVACVCAKTRTS